MNIYEYIKKNKYVVMMGIIMVVITITIHNFYYKKHKTYILLSALENTVKSYPINSFSGNSFVTDTYPIFKDVVFIGDSYAHNLSLNLGFDMVNYSCPGLTLKELKKTFEAASLSNKKYAVIFIGPNDFARLTELSDFHDTLESYIKKLNETYGMSVIITTYLHSYFTEIYEKNNKSKYSIDKYNDEILKLINNKKNIYYFDISDLDDNLEKYQNIPNDSIHFNYFFAVDYINRLYKFLIKIKKKEIFDCYG